MCGGARCVCEIVRERGSAERPGSGGVASRGRLERVSGTLGPLVFANAIVYVAVGIRRRRALVFWNIGHRDHSLLWAFHVALSIIFV